MLTCAGPMLTMCWANADRVLAFQKVSPLYQRNLLGSRLIFEEPLHGVCDGVNYQTLLPGRSNKLYVGPATFSSVQFSSVLAQTSLHVPHGGYCFKDQGTRTSAPQIKASLYLLLQRQGEQGTLTPADTPSSHRVMPPLHDGSGISGCAVALVHVSPRSSLVYLCAKTQ